MTTSTKPSSVPALRRTLRAKDYFTFAFGSMVGVGWMVVIDDWLRRGGAMGAMLGFLIGGLLLFPIGFVYGRLTEKLPDAGSEVAYTSAVWSTMVELLGAGLVDVAPIVTHRFPAGRFQDAFRLMDERDGVVGKILLEHAGAE